MPQITPLGVARQATLMADRSIDAVDDARVLLDEARDERARDAVVFAKQILIWAEYADQCGWATVAKHCWSQYTRTQYAMEGDD